MDANAFFSFRQMVSTQIIKVVYILGMIVITLSGIIAMSEGFLIGLLAIVMGNLFWRIFCEFTIIVFSIHDILGSIEANIKNKSMDDTA